MRSPKSPHHQKCVGAARRRYRPHHPITKSAIAALTQLLRMRRQIARRRHRPNPLHHQKCDRF
ncbi:hypothetical protein [Nostoc sp. FACHB-888]|uniref:hypothetical protein n=1 Tax=Nostoc sp. FACHB-888 TaxID=2692842 RepID=UPI0016853FA8|nr:hypothetical protein [Nostoc sp. FACHB-888]MBD2246033.1 hypothetical protein [Nostoc sp. FACHB-888]